MNKQSIFPQLALSSIYEIFGKKIETSNCTREELELLKQKRGCFVSIYLKDKSLRGCIGTINPIRDNLLSEIMENTKSASLYDNRFEPLKVEELENITVSVDVLSEMERIYSVEGLNPKVYGVVVICGEKSGVLLPDLEGVDTIDYQLEIALQKANINNDETFDLYRFTVERFPLIEDKVIEDDGNIEKENIRKNAVEGIFYPDNKEELIEIFEESRSSQNPKEIDKIIEEKIKNREMLGGIVCHAGYEYCKNIAVPLFEIIEKQGEKYDTVIVLNPNHVGEGNYFEIDSHDYWKTSLGKVEIDDEARKILDLPIGNLAQEQEHSNEVILPYLQYFLGNNFKYLPISLMENSYNNMKEIGRRIYELSKIKKILVIASSDFNHFSSREEGRRLDDLALGELINLHQKGFYDIVTKNNISICGLGPILVLLEYMRLKSKTPTLEVIRRGDSGEVTKDISSVVNYVSIIAIK